MLAGMCGKFTQMLAWRDLVSLADLIQSSAGETQTVTPMRFATVIALDDSGARRAVPMRWGLVAPDAPDPVTARLHIHARAETIERLPAFRDAFARRRGLIVVSTFNEGREITPSRTEQHRITPRDGKPLAIAAIWERWSGRNAGTLLTFAMVTVPPNPLIATITDRMPAVLAAEAWPRWLGEEPASTAELKALLQPYDGDWEMAREEKPRRSQQAELF